ncbi:hypothetical protein M413DRAFT_12967 [Hebeloma cylindrosporum]|uniref:Helicase C-terminal domain-containing protein n=1 Tax=Hebeloma cylindrosporum TaxID=76867 RepID=A0A0C3C1Y5_HEBCY|nr:hypothetical protein M413DRAFT_12967 [Hebeloma cylindrosporum h7]
MPTRKVSSCVFFLLSSQFDGASGNGWESADTLAVFGIDYAPSAVEDDPLPKGLTRADSRLIAEFIDAARAHDLAGRMVFIDADDSDAAFAPHRAAWMLLAQAHARHKRVWKRAVQILFGPMDAKGKHSKPGVGLWSSFEKLMDDLEKKDVWDPATVLLALKKIAEVRRTITWAPLKEVELQVWEAMIAGAAEAAGLEVDQRLRVAKDTVTDAEEKADKANKRGRKKKIVASTMDASDLQTLFSTLTDHFQELSARDDVGQGGSLLVDDNDDLRDIFAGEDDMGVTAFAGKTFEELSALLDFPEGRPPLFARYRSKDTTINSWDDPDNLKWTQGAEGLLPLALQWHQLCGVAAMVDKLFVQQRGGAMNVCLADDVGLGKSAQIMAFIAFLATVWFSEQGEGRIRPPILASKLLFQTKEKIPDSPHLIVVPTSLMEQWIREIKVFFSKKSIDYYQLPGTEAEIETFFTDPKSAWCQSKTPMPFRIVLITQSMQAFATLAGARFTMSQRMGGNPPDSDYNVKKASSKRKTTLFTREWCLFAVDEIHEYRGEKSRHFVGAVRVAKNSLAVIGASATPVHSNAKDLLNIARILRIPACCGQAGKNLELEHNRKISQARKATTVEDRQKALAKLQQAIQKGLSVDTADSFALIKAHKYAFVRELQMLIGAAIIRRTTTSKDSEGNLITNLPPKLVTQFLILLEEWEHALLHKELHVAGGESKVWSLEVVFESFLVKYRMLLDVPLPDIHENRAADIDWPVYTSVADFEARAGSKMKGLIRLLQHINSNDLAPPPFVDPENDACMKFPEAPPVPEGEKPSQMDKTLVSFQFASITPTLVSALNVHGIKHQILSGAMTPKQRDDNLELWRHDPECRVLLFTSVGNTGLNMTEARNVIHLDPGWSSTPATQTDGRAWRYGQEKTVHVYHLLALNTTDIIMHGHSNEKTTMMNAFVKKAKDNVMETLLKGRQDEEDDDDDDELQKLIDDALAELSQDPEDGAKAKGKKRNTKKPSAKNPKPKAKDQVVDAEGVEGGKTVPKPSKRKQAASTKVNAEASSSKQTIKPKDPSD